MPLKDSTSTNWDFVITPNQGWFALHLGDVWKYRDLLWIFVKRDFTTFYKQTILGPIWFFLQPLISTIIFTIIFNRVAKIPTDELPPILFYMSGIIAWNYFSTCLSSTSGIFTENAGLFSKVYFPRIIVPLSKIISALAKFSVQLIMFLGFYFYYIIIGYGKIAPSPITLMLLPIMIFQMALLGQGLGMIVSALTTKYRDLKYLVSFGTQLLMYASPIIYPLSVVPEKYKSFIIANPMTPVIEGFRSAFLSSGQFSYDLLFYSILSSILIFLLGLIVFYKVENNFIDTI